MTTMRVRTPPAALLSRLPERRTAIPHGKFARYKDVRWKAIAARNAGAKAFIEIAKERNFKEDRLSRLRYDNSAGDAGLPVVCNLRASRRTAADPQTEFTACGSRATTASQIFDRSSEQPIRKFPLRNNADLALPPTWCGARRGSRECNWNPRRL